MLASGSIHAVPALFTGSWYWVKVHMLWAISDHAVLVPTLAPTLAFPGVKGNLCKDIVNLNDKHHPADSTV